MDTEKPRHLHSALKSPPRVVIIAHNKILIDAKEGKPFSVTGRVARLFLGVYAVWSATRKTTIVKEDLCLALQLSPEVADEVWKSYSKLDADAIREVDQSNGDTGVPGGLVKRTPRGPLELVDPGSWCVIDRRFERLQSHVNATVEEERERAREHLQTEKDAHGRTSHALDTERKAHAATSEELASKKQKLIDTEAALKKCMDLNDDLQGSHAPAREHVRDPEQRRSVSDRGEGGSPAISTVTPPSLQREGGSAVGSAGVAASTALPPTDGHRLTGAVTKASALLVAAAIVVGSIALNGATPGVEPPRGADVCDAIVPPLLGTPEFWELDPGAPSESESVERIFLRGAHSDLELQDAGWSEAYYGCVVTGHEEGTNDVMYHPVDGSPACLLGHIKYQGDTEFVRTGDPERPFSVRRIFNLERPEVELPQATVSEISRHLESLTREGKCRVPLADEIEKSLDVFLQTIEDYKENRCPINYRTDGSFELRGCRYYKDGQPRKALSITKTYRRRVP